VSPERTLHVVVPEGIDDPTRPSGGNTYDRRLSRGLEDLGWALRTRPVAGDWPWAGEATRHQLAEALDAVPDGDLVLVDGLVASGMPEVIVPASRRLWLVVLLHMPIGFRAAGSREPESAVLGAAAAVVTTSEWTRRWLLDAYDLDPARIHVAHPGVDPARQTAGSDTGRNLLCVGAVTAWKGHDVLLAALSGLVDPDWRCVCVGSLAKAPDFVDGLFHDIKKAGLDDRFELAGPRTGHELEASYAAADLLVLPSHGETYGMVVTEALARRMPVLATRVGGVPEALGETQDGRVPGLLVPPGDVGALAAALTRWLSEPSLRDALRRAADLRRGGLRGWPETARLVADVLVRVGP
jgi:glycosyltransferase involved in cell wall biosynthesis